MSGLTGLPTGAERREQFLAELRIYRLNLQLLLAHLDWLGGEVKAGRIGPTGGERLLAEWFGTAENAAEVKP